MEGDIFCGVIKCFHKMKTENGGLMVFDLTYCRYQRQETDIFYVVKDPLEKRIYYPPGWKIVEKEILQK